MTNPLRFFFTILLSAFVLFSAGQTNSKPSETFQVVLPSVIVQNVPVSVTIKTSVDTLVFQEFIINGESRNITFENSEATVTMVFDRHEPLSIKAGKFVYVETVNPIPLWLSIVPPLLAILMALVFREVISSLFLGIFVGAAIIGYYQGGVAGIFTGFFQVISMYVMDALNNWGHLAVIAFSTIIGGIVALISKNGGMQGVVNRISKFADNARNGQLVTWFLGVGIFFDDYANTLVVGNTMRPVTDSLKISREKLSYIVDSTAAPIAAIAFVTTWIGAELGYIQDGLEIINRNENIIAEGPYLIFLGSLQYSFYPIFTLCFMLFVILQNKDFGPMLKAERRARAGGITSQSSTDTDKSSDGELGLFRPITGIKYRAFNAIIPIVVIIVGTIAGLLVTGWDQAILDNAEMGVARKLSAIIGNSDSYTALLWSSLSGLVVAILLTVSQKILSLTESVEVSVSGFKTMMGAIMILVLAWSLAAVTENMHTADFLTGLFADSVSPWLLPTITFILAAIVAFSTGSSWGTMAILYPLMLPLTWKICTVAGIDHDMSMSIFYHVVSAVLAGSVLGDHCSPISDTTILSSLASGCHHIDHVRTQLPYALTVGTVSILLGSIPGALGISSFITFPAGILVLFLIVKYLGKTLPEISHE